MTSRRLFLQSNAAFWWLRSTSLRAQTGSSVVNRDYWNDWPQYMAARVKEARARRQAALEAVRTAAQARERIARIPGQVWELVGGEMEKTPLNARMTGTVERAGYRIEKVIYESQPELYVTAHLYIPRKQKPPFPGILAPLGHASQGKAYRSYQTLYQNLASQGYAVLAFDPLGQGERLQYLDASGKLLRAGPTGEHDQAGRPLALLGASFALYRVWDGIRSLDYLLSRPEVDPERIGCTGHSGGGTMTMYLCALEPRIRAAVEVEGHSQNYASEPYEAPGAFADAEQNLLGSVPAGLDRADLLWAFAPKPLLVCFTPLDAGTTYSPTYRQGTEEIVAELKRVYGLLEAPDKVGLFTSPLSHDLDFFTRHTAYEWFRRWLGKQEEVPREQPFEEAPIETLNCTRTGQVLTSLGGRSVVHVNIDRLKAVAPGGPVSKAQVRERLVRLLALPGERMPLNGRSISANTSDDIVIEEVEFVSEPPVRVPGWFLKPADGAAKHPVYLTIGDDGKDSLLDDSGIAKTMVRRGFAVCSFDLRGLGVCTPRPPSNGPLFYGYPAEDAFAWGNLTLGKPVLGQRVWDFLRCLDYLESRPDVDRNRIHVRGVEDGALIVLLGAALDDRPGDVLLDRPLADLRSVVESPEYNLRLSWFVFGILKELDLQDAVAALAPRRCTILNATDARGEILAESTVRARQKNGLAAYSTLGRASALSILAAPRSETNRMLLSWLGTALVTGPANR